MGFDAGWWFGRGQARHDIEDVFGAQAAAFQYQLNTHQHRIEPGDRYGSQNLRHDSTAQASALEGHNQAILALEKCPVCSGRAPLVFQSPLGFKANCLDKKCATRYMRLEQTGRVFEQSIPESTGFTVVGRRAFTIRQMAGA